jgi:hypothetical protein
MLAGGCRSLPREPELELQQNEGPAERRTKSMASRATDHTGAWSAGPGEHAPQCNLLNATQPALLGWFC